MDAPDVNSSFRSTGSSRIESSASGGCAGDFGVLPLDEPKAFTQVPKGQDLIAPKPLLPSVSARNLIHHGHFSGPVLEFDAHWVFFFFFVNRSKKLPELGCLNVD